MLQITDYNCLKVLVLDLDETLIYSHNQPPKYPAEEIKVCNESLKINSNHS